MANRKAQNAPIFMQNLVKNITCYKILTKNCFQTQTLFEHNHTEAGHFEVQPRHFEVQSRHFEVQSRQNVTIYLQEWRSIPVGAIRGQPASSRIHESALYEGCGMALQP